MSRNTSTTRTPTPGTRTRPRSQRTTKAAARAILAPGTKVGAYELQDVIGRGGMGVVYKAYHRPLDRTVAVKVLKVLEHDADAARRFEREAQTSALLRHPNILSVFDFGDIEGAPYMVTEYLPGGTLSDRLHGAERLEMRESIALLRGIAGALDFAHGRSVIHRDVKPGNILLDEHGTPVLADFGLAKVVRESTTHTTGMPTGTPAYVAPEQITENPVGPAADRYSFAVMAFQLVTGRLPFEGRDFMKTLYAHVQETPKRASELAPDLPAGVDEVLAKGLSKEPQKRWETCGEMVDALELVVQGEWAGDSKPAFLSIPLPVLHDAGPHDTTQVLPVASTPADLPLVDSTTLPAFTPEVPAERRRNRALAWLITSGSFAAGFLLFLGLAALLRPQPATPTLRVSVSAALPGEAVQVTGNHLAPNQAYQLYVSGAAQPIGIGTADAAGGFESNPVLPAATSAGVHQLKLCSGSRCPVMTNITVLSAPTDRSKTRVVRRRLKPPVRRAPTKAAPRRAAASTYGGTQVTFAAVGAGAAAASSGGTAVPAGSATGAGTPSGAAAAGTPGAPAAGGAHGKSGQCHGAKC